MITILVVDDEKKLVALVKGYLEQEGYKVLTANDGATALELAHSSKPDLMVLDLMLPEVDGVEVCRRFRQFSNAYVIMLTARSEEIDKIVGLSVGADDYLTKPFSPRELVARVKAMLRRPRGGNQSQEESITEPPRQLGELVIDESQHLVTKNGHEIALTSREFSLLSLLSRHPGRVFTRGQLMEQVWGIEYYDEHVLEVHIGNLRKKLGEDSSGLGFIETVRGLGYRFDRRFA